MFRAAAIVGVGGLLTNNFLYFEAIHLTSVATALLLQYQAPVLVALYGLLIHRQRVTGRLWLSLALSVLGCPWCRRDTSCRWPRERSASKRVPPCLDGLGEGTQVAVIGAADNRRIGARGHHGPHERRAAADKVVAEIGIEVNVQGGTAAAFAIAGMSPTMLAYHSSKPVPGPTQSPLS